MTTRTPLFHISHLVRTIRPSRPSRRLLATSASVPTPEPLPSIPTCPSTSCVCAPMPEGLAIDYEKQLKGTMPPYVQHVVIRTGRDDWSSRIEDEPSTLGTQVRGWFGLSNLARSLKGLVGKGGKFHDPSHPVLITNSSWPRGAKAPEDRHVVQIFPQNLHFPQLPDIPEVIEDFARRFLTAERRECFTWTRGGYSNRKGFRGLADEKGQFAEVLFNRMPAPTILICGHMSRDSRCGILGPILKAEFMNQIWKTLEDSTNHHFKVEEQAPVHPLHYTSTSLCSHVGGHAFAGNVIIYFPVDFQLVLGKGLSPLAGKSVWYGRVAPCHVNGIVNETMMGGKVIDELLRGVNAFPGFRPLKRRGKQDIEYGRGKYFVERP